MPPDPGVATGILRPPVSARIGGGPGSDFGPRDTTNLVAGASDNHPGVDYPVRVGTPVQAADGGRVIFAGPRNSAGNVIVIDHGNGMSTRYLHMGTLSVRDNQLVAQGEVIGLSGDTGIARGHPHLHFELRTGGTSDFRRNDARSIDPEFLFGHPYVGATPGVVGRAAARGTSETATSRTVPGETAAPRTAASQTPADGLLRNGDSGPQVTEVQRKLKALGYDLGTTGPNRDGVDGGFGDATQRAVQQFQRDRNLPEGQQAGVYGPVSRREMADAERTGWRAPNPQRQAPTAGQTPAAGGTAPPTRPAATPSAGATTRAIDTAGPFAATSVGALIGGTVPASRGTSLGALNADQSYALGRAVFGAGPGAAALERIDRQLGTGGGVFVQRMIALGQHEGGLNYGRTNADPRSGSNIGTFQVGGKGSTPDVTRDRYAALLTRGLREVEALGGPHVDPRTLSPADRDIFAHVGHMTDRAQYVLREPSDRLLRQMADPTIRGNALATLASDRVQKGIPGIGQDVVRFTSRETGLRVDLAAVAARGTEPPATRREPAMPMLSPNALRATMSPAVAQWQAVLQAQGLPIGQAEPNGRFNATSEASTRTLQSRAGVGVDGNVGPATWARYAGIGGREIPATGQTPAGQTPAGAGAPRQTPPQAPPSGDGAATRPPATPGQAAPGASPPGTAAPPPRPQTEFTSSSRSFNTVRTSTDFIVVHTSLSPINPDVAPGPGGDLSAAQIHEIQSNTPTVGAIGYHYVVRKSGDVENGRPEDREGAHATANGMNQRSIGIVFSGDHDREPWTAAQEQSGVREIARQCAERNIPAANVIGHGETGQQKTCPGALVDMERVRDLVSQELVRLNRPDLAHTERQPGDEPLQRESGGVAPVPARESLSPGQTGIDVADVRFRLAYLGFPSGELRVGTSTNLHPNERYDAALTAGVQAYQTQRGITPADGVITPEVNSALIADVQQKIARERGTPEQAPAQGQAPAQDQTPTQGQAPAGVPETRPRTDGPAAEIPRQTAPDMPVRPGAPPSGDGAATPAPQAPAALPAETPAAPTTAAPTTAAPTTAAPTTAAPAAPVTGTPAGTAPPVAAPAPAAPATAAPAETAPDGPSLRRGARGEAVADMQRDLKTLGLDLGRFGPARDGVDGRFGPVTAAAVRQFEASHGMPETGVATPATLAALATAAREARAQTAGEAPGQTDGSPATRAMPVGGDGAATGLPQATPHPDAGLFLREVDNAVSNLLDRHTQDVPGTLAALIAATRGPGSGDLGRTTPDDVQRAFAEATAGRPALPLSRTEAGMIGRALDERSRLVAEGATPAPPAAPRGDGMAGRPPVETPVPTASDGAGLAVPPASASAPSVPSSVLPGGSSNLPAATAEPGGVGSALPRETGQRLPAETGPSR